MKRVFERIAFLLILIGFVSLNAENMIYKTDMKPEQLRAVLNDKYKGRLEAIKVLARKIRYPGAVGVARSGESLIETAANVLIGMGEVDLDDVEKNIENAINTGLTSIFKMTIAKARVSQRHEVSHSLFAISPWNKKIVWNKSKTHVLMITWVPGAYKAPYVNAIKSKQPMKIQWDAWVTAVPEVKEFAQKYVASGQDVTGFNLSDRIEQFLGLIPSKPPYAKTQDKYFVEMWVRPEDIFRPCLDAEIIDSECTMDPYEEDLKNLPPVFRDMSKLVSMTPEHKAWFENEKRNKYSGDWAMPWTRFGYTYDWGALTQEDQEKLLVQGASEYLIKKGRDVIIKGVIPTNEYPYSKE